jgi:hypothetical protein
MTIWTTEPQPFGPNHVPLLAGWASDNSGVAVPVAVDPATGAVLTEGSGGGGGGGSSTNANCYTGQVTVNTTQTEVSTSSHTLTNGIIIKAPSTNVANIYIGLTGVTTSTGDILEPGDVRGYAVNNTNLLYIISVASTTDIISYSGN